MTDRRPHVLLIMVDQLAAAWLPVYGHGVVQAPNLTALANEGVTFDAAYCPSPLCAPSRAGILTGRNQQRFGFEHNLANNSQYGVPTGEVMIGERMKE